MLVLIEFLLQEISQGTETHNGNTRSQNYKDLTLSKAVVHLQNQTFCYNGKLSVNA